MTVESGWPAMREAGAEGLTAWSSRLANFTPPASRHVVSLIYVSLSRNSANLRSSAMQVGSTHKLNATIYGRLARLMVASCPIAQRSVTDGQTYPEVQRGNLEAASGDG